MSQTQIPFSVPSIQRTDEPDVIVARLRHDEKSAIERAARHHAPDPEAAKRRIERRAGAVAELESARKAQADVVAVADHRRATVEADAAQARNDAADMRSAYDREKQTRIAAEKRNERYAVDDAAWLNRI